LSYRNNNKDLTRPPARDIAALRRHRPVSLGLGRSLDYLQSRADIDNNNIAYLGFSLGGAIASNLLAIETRFKTAILPSLIQEFGTNGEMLMTPTPGPDGMPEEDEIDRIPTLLQIGQPRYERTTGKRGFERETHSLASKLTQPGQHDSSSRQRGAVDIERREASSDDQRRRTR
jgi:hypothetical protein